MANKKVEVDIEVKGNLEGSIAELKELKRQLKNTAAGSEEFKKLYNQIDDLEDKIKGARKGSADWIDTLESAGGPLGMLGSTLNKLKVATVSWGTALKATGIGLLVSAIGLLVAAFTQTEGSMKKLQPLMIQLEKLFSGLVQAFQPLLEAFVEMATAVLPYIIKGITTFYGSLVSLLTLIKEAGTGVGKILKGIFTLDTDTIKQGYEQLAGSWDKTLERYDQFQKDFEKGAAKQTKTQKENADKALEIALKALESKKKIQDAELEKAKQVALAAAQSEKEKNVVEEEYAKKAYQLQRQQLLDKQKFYKAGSNEYKDLQADLIKLDADYTKTLSDELAKRKKLEDDANKVNVEAYIATLSQRDQELYKAGLQFNEQRKTLELAGITDLTQIQEQYKKQVSDINKKYDDEDRQKVQKQRQEKLLADLDAAKGDTEQQLAIYGQFEEDLKTMKFESLNEELQVRKQISDAILSLLDTQYQNELAKTEEFYNNKYGFYEDNKRFDKQYYEDLRKNNQDYQDALKNQLAAGTITQEEYNKRDLQLAKARKEINKQEVVSNQEKVKLIGDALGQLSNLVGQDTVAGKAFAIAKATIDTYQSAVSAYKSLAGIPVIGPALGAIAAAAAVASGIATVKKIVAVQVPNAPQSGSSPVSQSTPGTPGERPTITASSTGTAPTVKGFAEGGLIKGPGNETSDSIPALLSDGEFVVNSRSTALFKPLLSAINATTNLPQFAIGGLVGNKKQPNDDQAIQISNAIKESFGNQPIRTYVTAADISNQQQFDRTIKSRSLI